jgi:hypothetical protein
MYTVSTKRIKTNHALCTINHTITDNVVYLPVGTNNTYIQSDLQLKLFQKSRPLKYFVNTFPANRTVSSNSINFELYKGTAESGNTLYVICNQNFNIVMGQYLSTETNVAMVDLSNREVKTAYETHLFGATNTELPLHFSNKKYNRWNGITIPDALQTFTINTKYETIIYPYSISKLNGLYNIFELQEKEYIEFDYRLDPLIFPISVHKLQRPKFLFSGDRGQTWYMFDTLSSTFIQVTPTSTYFTFSEFNTVANTFKDYEKITPANFETYFGTVAAENIMVLAPCYLYTKAVSHKFWIDKLDIQDFLWAHSKNNKWTFVAGII